MKKTTVYTISPKSGAKSFYNKCFVIMITDGDRVISKTLYSYDTPILTEKNGETFRHWDDWSATTGRHIAAFNGMNKKQYDALPYKSYSCSISEAAAASNFREAHKLPPLMISRF